MDAVNASSSSENGADGARYRQLLKVTDKALSTVQGSAGGTYFRSFLTGIELNATRPADDTIDVGKVLKKRRLGAQEKQQADGVAAALVGEVCEQVSAEFAQNVRAAGVRGRLNALDAMFQEQPVLPGGGGERAPPPLEGNPEQLVRAKRMRMKLQDKHNLERLLEEAEAVHVQLEADLAHEKELVERCESDLNQRAAIVEKTYNIVMAGAAAGPGSAAASSSSSSSAVAAAAAAAAAAAGAN
jgi:hypothetical protein